MRYSALPHTWPRRVGGLLTAWLVLFLAACASGPATTPAPTATGGASAKTEATAAPKAGATTAPKAAATTAPSAQGGTPKVADPAGTPAPEPTLVEPKELAGKGNPNAKVTIIEFSDFQ